jgi:hypothetical protein
MKTVVSERPWGEFTEVVWSDGTVSLYRPSDGKTTIRPRFSAHLANHPEPENTQSLLLANSPVALVRK